VTLHDALDPLASCNDFAREQHVHRSSDTAPSRDQRRYVGVHVHKANAAFSVAGKNYPAGSYVVKTAQAFRPHVLEDLQSANIDQYFLLGGKLNALRWRTQEPETVFEQVEGMVMRRLGA
jgi:hypothetical protein